MRWVIFILNGHYRKVSKYRKLVALDIYVEILCNVNSDLKKFEKISRNLLNKILNPKLNVVSSPILRLPKNSVNFYPRKLHSNNIWVQLHMYTNHIIHFFLIGPYFCYKTEWCKIYKMLSGRKLAWSIAKETMPAVIHRSYTEKSTTPNC